MDEPRRCGRIAGCRTFKLPQGMVARLFAGGGTLARTTR